MRYRFAVLALGASLMVCFSLLWRIADAIPYCRAVALGDLDGDGDLDAFLANGRHEGTEPDRVWVNDGTGRFRDSGQRLGKNDSRSAALADLDGDGDLDVLLCGVWSPPYCEVVENDGNGGLSFRQWLVEVDGTGKYRAFGSGPGAAGDLDDDGDLDVLSANCCEPLETSDDGVTTVIHHHLVWLNDGGGNLADSGQRLDIWDSYAVALGDVDGDGDLDAFVASGQGLAPERTNAVWLNDGRGHFSDSGQRLGDPVSGGEDSRALALGDVDGDGDLDAFVGNLGVDRVWLNDGAGAYADSGQRLGDAWARVVRLADLDGDGDLDAFVASRKHGAQIWTNDGAGRFDPGRQVTGDLFNRAVALGDVDGDGAPDVVMGRARRGPRVWLNDGTGQFVPRDRPWVWIAPGVILLATVGLWWFRRRHQRLEPVANGD